MTAGRSGVLVPVLFVVSFTSAFAGSSGSLEKAQTFLAYGLFDDAKRELIEIAYSADASDSDRSAALLLLGEATAIAGDPARATQTWRELLQSYPDSPEAPLARAKVRVLLGGSTGEATAAPKVEPRPSYRILHLGEEPRQLLRLLPAPGTSSSVEFTGKLRSEAGPGGKELKRMMGPPQSESLRATVEVTAAKEGQFTMVLRVADGNDSMTARISERRETLDVQGLEALAPGLARSLSRNRAQIFPEEPLGLGGRWATEDLDIMQSLVVEAGFPSLGGPSERIPCVTTTTVGALGLGSAQLSWSLSCSQLAVKLDPKDQQATFYMTVTGSGTDFIDARQPMPVSSSWTIRTKISGVRPDSGPAEATLIMDMSMRTLGVTVPVPQKEVQ